MSDPSGLILVSGPSSPSRAVQPTAAVPHVPVQEVQAARKLAPFGQAPDRFQAHTKRHEPDSPGTDAVPKADRRAAGPHLEAAIATRPSGASAGFMTQVLGQALGGEVSAGLPGHRDGAALGSDAYRRAGGEPALYPTGATLFRLIA
jgi:hypothetical protein